MNSSRVIAIELDIFGYALLFYEHAQAYRESLRHVTLWDHPPNFDRGIHLKRGYKPRLFYRNDSCVYTECANEDVLPTVLGLTSKAAIGYYHGKLKMKGVTGVSDHDLIGQSYQEIIKTVFAQFYQASILAKTPEEKAKAEEIFQTGIAFARQVRDRAIAILPPV